MTPQLRGGGLSKRARPWAAPGVGSLAWIFGLARGAADWARMACRCWADARLGADRGLIGGGSAANRRRHVSYGAWGTAQEGLRLLAPGDMGIDAFRAMPRAPRGRRRGFHTKAPRSSHTPHPNYQGLLTSCTRANTRISRREYPENRQEEGSGGGENPLSPEYSSFRRQARKGYTSLFVRLSRPPIFLKVSSPGYCSCLA